MWPILYGDQLRQARLDDWIFHGVLDVEHLPSASGAGVAVRGELHFDAVVIGAGTAGLVAGARLAEGGARVCVLAKGVGSTHLAPGTIDVLGYAPEPGRVAGSGRWRSSSSRTRTTRTRCSVPTRWPRPFDGFRLASRRGPLPGYRYLGDLDHNHLLPTAVGALRPSALVPETMAAGDSAALERVCVVGTRTLRDFHAALCAANLSQARSSRRARSKPRSRLDRADQNSLGLARRFDDPAWRAAFAGAARAEAPGRRARRPARGARDPRPARRLVRPRAPARPPRVRDPDAASVGSRDAPVRDPARGATRAPAGGSCSAPRSCRTSATARG